MKTKKATKKLTLNREIITTLNKTDLNNANGGITVTIRCTTPTICIWEVCVPSADAC